MSHSSPSVSPPSEDGSPESSWQGAPTPDPLLTANLYSAGNLDLALIEVLAPVAQELRSSGGCLWWMRYPRRGEHLKIRYHAAASLSSGGTEPDGEADRVRALLERRVEEFFASLETPAERPQPRFAPPLDLEDEAEELAPDPSWIWTTYRRSEVVFGGAPFLDDDLYIGHAVECLGQSCDRILQELEGLREINAATRYFLYLELLLDGLAELGMNQAEIEAHLVYQRDWLVRMPLLNTGANQEQAAAWTGKLDGRAQRLKALAPKVQELWSRHDEVYRREGAWQRLGSYLRPKLDDPVYRVDPFAERPLDAAVIKVFHNAFSALGVRPTDQAALLQLILRMIGSDAANREILLRPAPSTSAEATSVSETTSSVTLRDDSLLLARMGGLPVEVLDLPHAKKAAEAAEAILDLEEEAKETASVLVDKLFAFIHEAPEELRGDLLAIKRDVFNRRSLERHQGSMAWQAASADAPQEIARMVELNEVLETRREELRAICDESTGGALEALSDLAADRPGWRRGLSLNSPDFGMLLGRLGEKTPNLAARKKRKLLVSLLRYTSRTALKLSPFSTLTRIGLGKIAETEQGVELVGHDWPEDSLFRLRRYLLEQIWSGLLKLPEVRSEMKVALSGTAQRLEEGYRILRLGTWQQPAEDGPLRLGRTGLAMLNFHGVLATRLEEILGEEEVTPPELANRLAQSLEGDPEEMSAAIERLVESGILVLQTPWPSHSARLEEELLEFLRGVFAEKPDRAAILEPLERLVALETSFFEDEEPQTMTRRINQALNELWQAVARGVGYEKDVTLRRHKEVEAYEDVWIRGTEDRPEVLRFSKKAAEEIAETLRPWTQIASLEGYHHDFLHTLDAVLRREEVFVGREEVPALELFQHAQKLWGEMARLERAGIRRDQYWQTSFNPLQLPEIEKLQELRRGIWERLGELFDTDEAVRKDQLWELLDSVPEMYRSPFSGCYLLQQAGGGLWVLNRLFEGTGRYGSRYSQSMPEEVRERYLDPLRVASKVSFPDGEAELLDLVYTRHDTAELHAPQTRWGLEGPGEKLDRDAYQILRGRDLRVRLRDGGLPELIGPEGRRFAPVHLGGAARRFLPPWERFLSLWGTAEILDMAPPQYFKQQGPVSCSRRAVIENVVLKRKRWVVRGEEIRQLVSRSAPDAFLDFQRRCREWGMPERVFLLEKVHGLGGSTLKPQYLDRTSPAYLEVLRAAAKKAEQMVFEEALPDPRLGSESALPRDARGSHWAVELSYDTHALFL